jgi:transcriptional regulator with XRE-family HTH domain
VVEHSIRKVIILGTFVNVTSMHLRKYLREKRIPYREFAERLGVTEQSVKNIVCGTRRPGLTLALKIEKLTDGQVTPQQLVEDFEKASQTKLSISRKNE